jgi:hypothetical protein
MPKWKYRKIDLNDLSRKGSEIDVLNTLGYDDWDLVAITPTPSPTSNDQWLRIPPPTPAQSQQNADKIKSGAQGRTALGREAFERGKLSRRV